MRTLIPARFLLSVIILMLTVPLCGQLSSMRHTGDECTLDSESFSLKETDLSVIKSNGAILFTAGMTIDADGAPNAYGPHNRGLDYTANARGAHGWVALVTNDDGRPVVQKRGPYRGFYVSTTSLQQADITNLRDPRKYINATKVPYIALPSDFAARFNISLGDLAVVINQANGRYAYAIFADVGPKGRIGEGSIALAKQLGIPANPRHDSVEAGIIYLIFPASALSSERGITARRVKSSAARLYHRWGGTQRLRSCDLLIADTGTN